MRAATSFIFALAITLLSMAGGSANAQTAQSPLPKPTGYVNDYAGVIDNATKERLETTLGNLDRQQSIQFAVVTIDTTGAQDIFDYSLAVARGWGIGSKDTSKPSLLLLVAIKDRKYFTQVSRHLEGDLPDGLVGQIQREQLVPAFRNAQYGKGLSDTVETYITTVATKDGFISRVFFFNFVPWLYVALLFSHHYLPSFLARRIFTGAREEKTLLVGSTEKAAQLRGWLRRKADIGLRTVGLVCDEQIEKTEHGIPVLRKPFLASDVMNRIRARLDASAPG